MQKMHFKIIIHGKPQEVWDAVVDSQKYREWTSVFHPDSCFEGGWEKGNRICFLACSKNGEKEGMIAEIAESRKYSFISIKHLGYISGGVEDTISEKVKQFAPAYENYSFTPIGDNTKFEVDIDIEEDYVEMFSALWPKALKKLKETVERIT
jgi:hypothetical protein